MTERNDHSSEGFLVDGVAPSVIGADDGPVPVGEDVDYEPPRRREPPTTPIPAQSQARYHQMPNPRQNQQHPQGPGRGQAEERKGWLSRMFGRE